MVSVTVCVEVALIATLPKLTLGGFADAASTPVPWSGTDMATQVPPATGHSSTVSVSLAAPTAVGANVSFTVHVPGPVNPPPAPHESKSNEKGGFSPLVATDAL